MKYRELITELLHIRETLAETGEIQIGKKFSEKHIELKTGVENLYSDVFNLIKILPSDEEIKETFTTTHYSYHQGRHRRVKLDRIQGGKVIRDQIKTKIKDFTDKF